MQHADTMKNPVGGLCLRHVDAHHYTHPEKGIPDFQSAPADIAFLNLLQGAIRNASMDAAEIDQAFAQTGFPHQFDRLILVLYAPGRKRILVSRAGNGKPVFSRVLEPLLAHPRLHDLNSQLFQLQIDFVLTPPAPMDFYAVGMAQKGEQHFEIGIDGMMFYCLDGNTQFFLPGDSFVRSFMSMTQLRDNLNKVYGEEFLRKAKYKRFRSESFISCRDSWRRLFRGYPVVGAISKEKIEHAIELAIGHIKRTQAMNGQFLYYYDATLDSRRDHEHPKRDPEKNPYYNILRHSGGGLTCLFYEKYSHSGNTCENILRAIEYLIAQTHLRQYGDREGAFIYHEKKSKLGGSGLALYLIAEYQLLTGDTRFSAWADKFAWHLINQITESGEFIYYNIYLDKPVLEQDNQEHFSFYYPGEAICGLAKYLHLVSSETQKSIFEKLHKALEFLIIERPKTHASHYTKVPSDAWLMMGIMELWDFKEMRDQKYADFVFSDANQMIDQLYKVTDAPYPDYAGAFYYEFGDYPYADGARCEGLLGAYELAIKMDDQVKAKQIWQALRLTAWAVMHLVNTEDAIYFAKNPAIALGGIRFKYTRQWFRIDTIQHVASFYSKMLPYWDRAESLSPSTLHKR